MSLTTPERLVFDLTWAGIKAGSATLETIPGPAAVRIVATTQSAPWVSVLYPVNDYVESVIERSAAADPGTPIRYRAQLREGKRRRDREAVFNRTRDKISFADHLSGETREVPVRGKVFDPLSSFYHVRSLRMEQERPVILDVFDNRGVSKVEVHFLRRERIKTRLGEFDTIVIRPRMKAEGTFIRRGDMYIWLTDDQRRLPVKMQTRVAVGNITATLVGGTY